MSIRFIIKQTPPQEGDTDSSPVDNTVVPTNMVYSLDSKFGHSSANFNGSNYMTISPNTNLVLELVWTVRAWIKTTTTGQQYFLQYSSSGEINGGYTLGIANASGYPYMVYLNSSGNFVGYKIGSSSVATGDWVHYEFARNGSNFYFFINGTSLGANSGIGGTTIMPTPVDPFSLGRSSAGTFAFTGLIDEVEIIKGVTLHTSNFSVPTVPSVATPNHVLLMHMDDDGAV